MGIVYVATQERPSHPAPHRRPARSDLLQRTPSASASVPESEVRFDQYGKGRVHDLGICGKTASERSLFVGVEAKVNETFGKSVGDEWREANKFMARREPLRPEHGLAPASCLRCRCVRSQVADRGRRWSSRGLRHDPLRGAHPTPACGPNPLEGVRHRQGFPCYVPPRLPHVPPPLPRRKRPGARVARFPTAGSHSRA